MRDHPFDVTTFCSDISETIHIIYAEGTNLRVELEDGRPHLPLSLCDRSAYADRCLTSHQICMPVKKE